MGRTSERHGPPVAPVAPVAPIAPVAPVAPLVVQDGRDVGPVPSTPRTSVRDAALVSVRLGSCPAAQPDSMCTAVSSQDDNEMHGMQIVERFQMSGLGVGRSCQTTQSTSFSK